MKKTLKSKKPVAAESIAKMAARGKGVSHFFQGNGRIMKPIQHVNLEELDKAAQGVNRSR